MRRVPYTRNFAADPVSQDIARYARDMRNLGLLRTLTRDKDDTPEAEIGRSVVAKVGEKVAERVLQAVEAPRGGSDPVKAKLEEALDTLVTTNAIRSLGAGENPQALPQSATDVIRIAESATNIHKGAAETAMSLADAERDRRLEAEARAESAFEAGAKEAGDRWSSIMEIVRSQNETALEMMRALSDARLQAEQARHEATVNAILQRLERLEASVEGRVAQVKAEADKELAIERERHQHALDRLALEQQLERKAAGIRSPEEIVQTAWAESYAESVKAKVNAEKALANEQVELVRDLRGQVPKLPQLVDRALTIFGAPPQGEALIPDQPPDLPPPEGEEGVKIA